MGFKIKKPDIKPPKIDVPVIHVPKIDVPMPGLPKTAEPSPRIPDSLNPGNYSSNEKDVHANVEKGDWAVAYGRRLTETDAINGLVAAGCDIFSEGASGGSCVSTWIHELVQESMDKMKESITEVFTAAAREEAEKIAVKRIRELLKGRVDGDITKEIKTLQFKAGVAKITGSNQVMIPHLAGGGTRLTVSNTFAYEPYVGMRFKKIVKRYRA